MPYSVAHADIAHQRVEDEVIVVNLLTGAYFSLRHAAADAWDLLTGGAALPAAAAVVAARYGVAVDTVATDLDPLVARLLADDLIVAVDGDTADAAAIHLPEVAAGAAYAAPTLDKYDDMEELLLLDPIHEVDDAGWPVVATEPGDE